MKLILSLFTLILFTGSCNSSKAAAESNINEKRSEMQNTLSGNYIITQIGSKDKITTELTISFGEKSNKITGFAGCNRFFGTYILNGSKITFSDVASSKKLCKTEVMDIEYQLLKALNRVNSFTIKNNTLSLLENDTLLVKAGKAKSAGTKATDTTTTEVIIDSQLKTIKYRAITRGAFNYTEISKSNIATSTDNTLKKIDNCTYNVKDWEELNILVEAIHLETFKKLKAPSTKRFSGAAANATLSLFIGDIEYMTPEFDHGNPPKEIEALVNKVLSIKENAIKQ